MVGVISQLLIGEFVDDLLPGHDQALLAQRNHILVRARPQAVERALLLTAHGIVLPQLAVMLDAHVPALVCAKLRQRQDLLAGGAEANTRELLRPDRSAYNGVQLDIVTAWHFLLFINVQE